MKEQFFLLTQDFSHVGDAEKDAFHVPFDGSEGIGSDMLGISQVDLPSPVFFQAGFDTIPRIDFPVTDLNVLVFSKRMLNTLLDVGPLNYHATPAVMFDYTYLGERFKSPGQLKDDVPANYDYSIIQLLEFTEAFDYDKSEYEEDDVFPDEVGIIKKLVLKEPDGGFPPIFKMKECMRYTFVTGKAKEALIKNGIQGCVFEGLDRVN